jgi:hypothetical protein
MPPRPELESRPAVHVPAAALDDIGARPLTQDERTLADEVARRLRLELRGLVELLTEQERGASAMARALEIDRNTCQRIVAATGRGEADASMLVQLPGIAGLRQFMEAMGKRFPGGEAAAAIAGVGAAVDRFEKVIDELAGSQRKLRERLDMDRVGGAAGFGGLDSLGTAGPSDNLSVRRSLFRAAVDVVGRWSETRLSLRIIRPVPGDPMHTENVRMTGHVGHMARAISVPLEVYSGVPEQLVESEGSTGGPDGRVAFQSLDARQSVGDTPGFLMREFCSQPLPRVTSRAAGAKVVHAIDEMGTPGQASDIFVADRRAGRDKHPATQHPAIGEVSTIMNYPARRFVMDVFLHRDIARRCIPSLEVHLSPLPSGSMILSRWSTKIPGGPRLELLGTPQDGAQHLSTDAYPRHAEAVHALFASAGWDASEFIGYRCDVPYPIWRAAYCMLFDFTGSELPEPIGMEPK